MGGEHESPGESCCVQQTQQSEVLAMNTKRNTGDCNQTKKGHNSVERAKEQHHTNRAVDTDRHRIIKKGNIKKRERQKQMSLTFQQSGHHRGSDSACCSGKLEFVMIKSVGFKTTGSAVHKSQKLQQIIIPGTSLIFQGTSWTQQNIYKRVHRGMDNGSFKELILQHSCIFS